MVQQESCKYKFGLNKNVRNSKQKWNHEKWWCESKWLDDWGSFEKDHISNSSACDCDSNKTCKTVKYLDTKSYSCEKRLIGKLVSKCVDEITPEALLKWW